MTTGRDVRSTGARTRLAAVLAAVVVAAAPARADERAAALVVDANTGAILHHSQADAPRYPASLTKMMTLYIVFELMEQGRLSATTPIKVSATAAAAAPSKLDLDEGDTIPLIDAIKALVTKSANDVAVAVAEHIAGDEAAFARLMTTRARRLGMTATTFRNASGLPDPGQVTTARDMITLAMRLNDDFPRQFKLFSIASFNWGGATYRNHNTLLRSFLGTDGIKTGYTRLSGFNLVASVRRDGKHILAAVFGGATAGSRDALMRVLLSRALPHAATTRTRRPAPVARPEPQLVAEARPVRRPVPPPIAAKAPPAETRPEPAVAAPRPPRAEVTAAMPAPAARAPVAAAADVPDPALATSPAVIEIARVRPVTVPIRSRAAPPSEPTAVPRGPVSEPMAAPSTVVSPPAAEPVAAPAEPATAEAAPASTQRRLTFVTSPDAMPASRTAAGASGDPSRREQPPGDAPPARPARSPAEAAVAARPQESPARLTQAPLPFPSLAPSLASSQTEPGPIGASPEAQRSSARSPSSLEAQAAALAGRGTVTAGSAPEPRRIAAAEPRKDAPAYRLKGPESPSSAPRPVVPAAAGYQIQVGAYASSAEADHQIAAVRAKASPALDRHAGVALPLQKDARTLYRARFSGFDAQSASDTCLELRRRTIDCFVTRAE